jgi:hypothetical protein
VCAGPYAASSRSACDSSCKLLPRRSSLFSRDRRQRYYSGVSIMPTPRGFRARQTVTASLRNNDARQRPRQYSTEASGSPPPLIEWPQFLPSGNWGGWIRTSDLLINSLISNVSRRFLPIPDTLLSMA